MPSPGREKCHDVTAIRTAVVDDIDRILDIELQFGLDAYSRRHFVSYLKAKIFWVIEKADCVIGYAIVQYRKNGRTAHLHSIAVDQSQHGRGIGRCLLTAIEAHCRQNNISQIKLECRTDNRRTLEFYKQAGYSIVGLHNDYYADGSSAWQMSKTIIGFCHSKPIHNRAMDRDRTTNQQR